MMEVLKIPSCFYWLGSTFISDTCWTCAQMRTHTHTRTRLSRLSSASLIKRRYSNRPSGRGEIMKCDFTLQLRLIFLTAWLDLTGEYSREDTLPQQKLQPLISARETKNDREEGMGRDTMSWSSQTAKSPNGKTQQWILHYHYTVCILERCKILAGETKDNSFLHVVVS